MSKVVSFITPTGRGVLQDLEEYRDWKKLGADEEGRLPVTYRRLMGMFPGLVSDPVAGDRSDQDPGDEL